MESQASTPREGTAIETTRAEDLRSSEDAAAIEAAPVRASTRRRIRVKKGMMYGLGGYALVNIGVGIAGGAVTEGDVKHFHQMNAMWNGVNMIFAVVGLIGAYRADPEVSGARALRDGRKSTAAYAINIVLDLAYVTTGATLLQYGHERDDPRLRGWGRAIMVQGGFLVAFDIALLAVTERENRRLVPLLQLDGTQASFGVAGRF
jgi:hypothetical protein